MTQRDLSNILAGPVKIKIGATDLGHTEGETRLTITPRLREQTADSLGETVVDLVQVGADVILEARVAEWTLAGLQLVFPLGLTGNYYLGLGRAPGARLRDEAQTLTLHPLELPDNDTSKDVTFWQAVAAGAVAVEFSNSGDRVFEVTFRILPDLSKPAGMQLGKIGAA